jgi:hypothetical protein
MDWPPDFQGELARRFDLERAVAEDGTGAIAAAAKAYYANGADGLVAFVRDNCWVVEPRNANKGLPTKLPAVPFPRQEDYLRWLYERFSTRTSGPCEKSRDSGATWMACAFSIWLWLFHPGVTVGFGSRKEAYVDKLGDMDSIFEKARSIVRNLPAYLIPAGFSEKSHALYMRLINPENGSTVKGEAGDNIGRGGRTSVYFVDEAAFIERPKAVNAALSANTDCRIDISSCRAGTDFQDRCNRTSEPVKFVFDISAAPWHTPEWIEQKRGELSDDIFAQEFLRDSTAAIEGQLIKSVWVEASIDADKVLGFEPTGARVAALDVADGGDDRNALAARHGVLVTHVASREGLMADGGGAWGYAEAKQAGADELLYDSIGVGAGAAAVLRDKRDIKTQGWSAAGAVVNPEALYPPNVKPGTPGARKNKDQFHNAKAQGWWMLRDRFIATFKAVTDHRNGIPFTGDPDNLISLSSGIAELQQLKPELSQVTFGYNNAGKIVINKAPDGHRSPNRADSVMIAFAPKKAAFAVIGVF